MRGGAPGTRRPALAAAGFLALLAGVGWLGLRIAPSPPPRHAERTPELETVALPPDLPEPVRGYYLVTVGEEPPRIKTAVVWGRGYFNLNGLWFPARFKTYYDIPGRAFRRDLDLTWFGIQVFRGSDVYVGGKGELEISGLLGFVEVAYEGEDRPRRQPRHVGGAPRVRTFGVAPRPAGAVGADRRARGAPDRAFRRPRRLRAGRVRPGDWPDNAGLRHKVPEPGRHEDPVARRRVRMEGDTG